MDLMGQGIRHEMQIERRGVMEVCTGLPRLLEMIKDVMNRDTAMKAFKSKHRRHKRDVNGALCAELMTRHTEYDATSIAYRYAATVSFEAPCCI
jgi:hypothetical protein